MESHVRLVPILFLVACLGALAPPRAVAAAQAACIACTEWYDVPGEGTGVLKGHLGLCARCKAGGCAEGADRMRKGRAALDDERRAVRLLPDGDSNKDRRVRVLQAKLEFYDKAWAALLGECPKAGDLEGTEVDEPPRHRARAAEAAALAGELAALAEAARERARRSRDLVALGAVLASDELGPAVAWDAEAMRVQGELGRLGSELGRVLAETAREWALLGGEEERTAAAGEAAEGIARPGDYRNRFTHEEREPAPPPAGASVPERHGIEALTFRTRVLAALRGCRVALGRYRRARRAGDGAAVDLQAQVLEESAERARTAIEEAEEKLKLFEREAETTTRAVGSTLLANREQWEPAYSDLVPRLEAEAPAGGAGASLAAVVPDPARRAMLVARAKGLGLDAVAAGLAYRAVGAEARKRAEALPEREKLGLELLFTFARRVRRRLAGTGIELVPAGGLPRSWWAAPAGRPFTPVEALSLVGARSPPLLPGRYDVHISQDGEDLMGAVPRTVTVSTGVEVEAGATVPVALAGQLAPVPAPGVPPPAAWYALRLDGPAPVVVAGRSDGTVEPLYVPPGRYGLLWAASAESAGAPVRVAGPVEVLPGRKTALPVATGIAVVLDPRLPPLGTAGGIVVVRAGEPLEARVAWSSRVGVLPLPPGRYDVHLAMDAEHADRPTPLAAGLEVPEGRLVELRIDAGLELPGGAGEGWWGATLPGMPAEARLGWARDGAIVPLAPGRYDVHRGGSLEAGATAERLAVDVEVKAGTLTRVGPGAEGAEP